MGGLVKGVEPKEIMMITSNLEVMEIFVKYNEIG